MDKIEIELGEDLDEPVSKYVKGNISNASLNITQVDMKEKTGIYEAVVLNKYQKLNLIVEVIDTIPPKADIVQGLSFQTYQAVAADLLISNIVDYSNVSVEFADQEVYHIYAEGGEVKEEVILIDELGNKTSLTVSFMIIADIDKPILKGIQDITIYEEVEINYLAGVSARDDRDGDITSLIEIDDKEVKINVPGKYEVIYSVSDSSNNVTTVTAYVMVLEDKSPLIEGATNKTVYVNSTIDYMKGVTATDDRDGDLTSEIKLDSSNVNIKKWVPTKLFILLQTVQDIKQSKQLRLQLKQKILQLNQTVINPITILRLQKSSDKNNSSGSTSSGFQFYDVNPSGEQPNGHIYPGGEEDVGTWG